MIWTYISERERESCKLVELKPVISLQLQYEFVTLLGLYGAIARQSRGATVPTICISDDLLSNVGQALVGIDQNASVRFQSLLEARLVLRLLELDVVLRFSHAVEVRQLVLPE